MIDENTAAMLQQAMSGGSDPRAALHTALESAAAHGDVRSQLMAKLIAERFATSETDSNTDVVDEPDAVGGWRAKLNEVAQERDRLKRRLRELIAELRDVRSVNDELAAALGACHLCWGEDPECEHCHGAGRPGAALPDRALLSHYVRPVLERMQRARNPRQRNDAAVKPSDAPSSPPTMIEPKE